MNRFKIYIRNDSKLDVVFEDGLSKLEVISKVYQRFPKAEFLNIIVTNKKIINLVSDICEKCGSERTATCTPKREMT